MGDRAVAGDQAPGDARIVRVRLLGGVQAVAADGSVVDLGSASQRRLLALLALHAPNRLRSERLSDTLGVSVGALRKTVSRLRVAIGADVLLTAGTGYSLGCDVDAALFCAAVTGANGAGDRLPALEAALRLWTGPPLEEFDGEAWAASDVTRLTEIHAGTVDDLADELLGARRPADAVVLLEGQTGRHPYRDRSRELLIRAYAQAGRQADALRAFQSYRSLLIEELGTEPSPDVIRTERRVASGWNGVDEQPDGVDRQEGVAVPLPAGLVHGVAFIGRTSERAALQAELEAARSGSLRCVVLEGEPGIGKTTLLAELARASLADGRATVLYGRCDETGVPLEPFGSLLDACVDHAPMDLVSEHVARCGGELGRICHRLAARVSTAPLATDSDDRTERFLAFEAAADLLRRIAARRLLVLVIDDIQWAEPTALLLLRHLARALADAPVLLLVSRRDPGAAVTDELRATMADLDRSPISHLRLGGLDDHELDVLVGAAAPSSPAVELERMAATLQDETAGNPLFASQLIRHWLDDGRVGVDGTVPSAASRSGAAPVPPSLRDIVWSRVQSLGDEAATVLKAAAVLGQEFHEDVLIDLVDLPEPAVTRAIDRAVEAGVLVDLRYIRRSLRFVHGLMASALYGEVGPAARARLHGRAAAALERSMAVPSPEVITQLARHCTLAGSAAEALAWSVRAGDHAFDHLAPAEAAHHYQVALDAAVALGRPAAERAGLLVALGDAQHRAGFPQALKTIEEGAELARATGENAALVRAALAGQGFVRHVESPPEHLAIVEAALGAVADDDVVTRARLLGLLAQSLMHGPDDARREAVAQAALAVAEASDDPVLLAHVAPAVLDALWGPGSGRLRSAIAARAVVAAESSGDPRLQFMNHLAAYDVAVQTGDATVAGRSLARLRATVRATGEPRLRWAVELCETFEATMAGRLTEAEERAVANLDFGTQIAMPEAFPLFAGQFFVIGTFAGRHDELFPVVEQAAAEHPGMLPFRLAHGIICLVVGRPEVAAEVLREGQASGFTDVPAANIWTTSIIGYAILAIGLGDVEAARALRPLLEPYATEVSFNGITSQGPIAAYVGKLASLLGDHEVAEEHLRSALATATSFGWTYHRSTTLLALAEARHARVGMIDDEARGWLAEASDLCRTHGFRTWLGAIDALLVERAQ